MDSTAVLHKKTLNTEDVPKINSQGHGAPGSPLWQTIPGTRGGGDSQGTPV